MLRYALLVVVTIFAILSVSFAELNEERKNVSFYDEMLTVKLSVVQFQETVQFRDLKGVSGSIEYFPEDDWINLNKGYEFSIGYIGFYYQENALSFIRWMSVLQI
jgi:hypothetical protein